MEHCECSPVEALAQGEYVKRKADAKTIYIRGEYSREDKRYTLTDTEDMNRTKMVRKGTKLFHGFTY